MITETLIDKPLVEFEFGQVAVVGHLQNVIGIDVYTVMKQLNMSVRPAPLGVA